MKHEIKFEIMTEDKNTLTNSLLIRTISKHFEGFIVHKQIGYWKGVQETSQTITIITADSRDNRLLINRIAEQIRGIGRQECVLVIETPVKTELI